MTRTAHILCYAGMAVAALASGCQSVRSAKAAAPIQVLSSPHELRVSLDRQVASPGDLVNATIEFENTGTGDLWIPRRREIFFGFEKRTEFVWAKEEQWESSCDGIEFVRVRPRQRVKYEKGFVAPSLQGDITVYITANRSVRAPLRITRNEPPPAPEPTGAPAPAS